MTNDEFLISPSTPRSQGPRGNQCPMLEYLMLRANGLLDIGHWDLIRH